MEDKYLSRHELAKFLGISTRSVDRRAADGGLPEPALIGSPGGRKSRRWLKSAIVAKLESICPESDVSTVPIPTTSSTKGPIMSKTCDFTTTIPNSKSLLHKGDNVGPKYREIGGSIDILKRIEIVLTREKASEFLALKEFIAERSIKTQHVADLQKQMSRGLFRPEFVTVSTAYCQEDKQTYRLNGQHCCWAVFNLPSNFNPEYKINLIHYKCKTIDDVRILYSIIDRNLPRSTTTVVNSILFGRPGYEKYDQKVLNLVVAGFSTWKWESYKERTKFDIDAKCHIMDTEYHQLTHQIMDFYHEYGQNRRHIRRASVAAAMFETFQKCAADAERFWESVVTGVGFESRKDPRLKLKEYLDQNWVCMRGGSDTSKKAVGQEEMYRKCIKAWNKFRNGEECVCLSLCSKSRQRAK
ncbi:MAG: hypothetical protein WC919_03975 [Candidatus Paceibacterota bacterium]|jgi:predicted DNA-binding transcriptional regulator AlpA